jgi:ABC-type antimicrobial peptide transport system permease subunit
MAYLVSQGTRDMGIRLALGATPASIQRLVLSRGVVLGIAGVVIGLAGAAGATRLMQTVLFGVAPVDGVTFSAIGAMILLVVLAACAIPARRASRTDPTVALRSE